MISCVYCGGEHDNAIEARACWERQQAGERLGDHDPVPESPGHDREPPHRSDRRARVTFTAATIDQRGPHQLGRHAIVEPGDPDPVDWEGCERVVITPGVIVDPDSTVRRLRDAAHQATSVVIEIDPAVGASLLATQPLASVESAPTHELDPSFTFWLDELHHLVFSNSFDARGAREPRSVIPERWVDFGPVRYLPPIDAVPVIHELSVEVSLPTNSSDADLAPDQLAAVTHPGGTARIIAPAGSGKTRVLTERARHLLTGWHLPPSAVCLVAFNKRAQVEMRERTADLPDLQVRTLNSIALAIINGRAPFALQQRRWQTLDETEVRRLLERFIKLPRRLNVDPLAVWIDALSSVRLGMRDPAAVEADYGGDVSGLATVYSQYVDALDRSGAVDFDHQIVRAIEVLLTQPDARRIAQEACRVMLVDEFQDLTPAHLLLVRLLAGPAGAVFGVGDDDQTIYSYNGADPAWLIEFGAWFPGAGDHPLEVNYRCPAGVVDSVDRLLRHNRWRVTKTIRAAPDAAEGGWSVDVSNDPVASTVRSVDLAIGHGADSTDIAVLTRVNTTLAPVQVALSIAGFPISGGVGAEYAERTAVRAAFAWLRLADAEVLSDRDVLEALRRPSRKLHPRVREWVAEQPNVAAIRRLADRLNTDRDSVNVASFADDLERLQALHRRGAPTADVLNDLVDRVGLGSAVSTLDDGRHGTNRAAQSDDLQAFRQLAALYDRHGNGPFEAWLRGHLASPRSDVGVALSTIHRVKGQEWPHVVVHLADADQFPHRLADNVEEERRLFHVAVTRASQHVTIVAGMRPSPFIDELTTEPPTMTEPAPAATRLRRVVPTTNPAVHPLVDRETVFAVVGLTLVDQGQQWEITDLEPAAAVARRGELVRRFDLGEVVVTVGRQRGKLGVRPGTVSEPTALAFDALRAYRDRVRGGKPAYTVFDDKTLAGIADAQPADESELLAVTGVGPAKLEQYGDDIIELISRFTGGS